jgi:hypothetical protein
MAEYPSPVRRELFTIRHAMTFRFEFHFTKSLVRTKNRKFADDDEIGSYKEAQEFFMFIRKSSLVQTKSFVDWTVTLTVVQRKKKVIK